jgi:hypothetical protein
MNLDPMHSPIALLGVPQPRRRSRISTVHSLALTLLFVPLTGCVTWNSGNGITGSGRALTREFDLAGFTRVAAGSAFHVRISQGAHFSVTVTVDDNLVDYLDVSRSGDTLRLSLKPNVNIRNATLKAAVIMPELTGLDLSGATGTTIAGFSSEKPLAVELSGASHLRGDIQSGDVRFGVTGAATVELRGGAGHLKIKASGASTVNLEGYATKDTAVQADGASHVTVNANGKLEATASGASSIRYVGKPVSIQSHTSGASSVRRK